MKPKIFITAIILFIFSSCDNTDNTIESLTPEEDPYKIRIESYIKDSKGIINPDRGADVFIYWGIYSLEIADYEFNDNDGSFFDDDNHIIKPDITTKLNEEGKCILSFPEVNEKMTFLIRSNLIKDGFVITSSTNSRKEISFINTFNIIPY